MKIKITSIRTKSTGRMRSHVHFFVKNESVLANFVRRWSRPYEEYRKLLPKVFKKLKIEPVKASWRQNAGCACGCSPAFILEDQMGEDIFVNIRVS